MTGIGPFAVRCPRVRDRGGQGPERIRFSSVILPPYARRSKSLEVLIPMLYLKGVSTGDFEEAGRLKEVWSEEHTRWSKRDLSGKRYVYFWVDGIHVQARLEDAAYCLLVIIGATPEGKKELVGLIDGMRESAQSWKELLLDLKRRGLTIGPELAVADGALGFWQAIEEVWPKTRGQRCWVHKTANVLNKLPKSQQSKVKRALQEIWMAETKKDELVAFDAFVDTWGIKYDKAAECLIKDREVLLAFYDFPAERLETSAHDQRHRKLIRDRASPNRAPPSGNAPTTRVRRRISRRNRSCRSHRRARENSLAPGWPTIRDDRANGAAPPRDARLAMIRYALACDEGTHSRAGLRTRRPTTVRSSGGSSAVRSAIRLRSRRQSWRRAWRERKGAAMRPYPRRGAEEGLCPRSRPASAHRALNNVLDHSH
jgi:transposase-like protein